MIKDEEKYQVIYNVIKNEDVKEKGLDSYVESLEQEKTALSEAQDYFGFLVSYYCTHDLNDTERNRIISTIISSYIGIISIPLIPIDIFQRILINKRLSDVETLKALELYDILNDKLKKHDYSDNLSLMNSVVEDSKRSL